MGHAPRLPRVVAVCALVTGAACSSPSSPDGSGDGFIPTTLPGDVANRQILAGTDVGFHRHVLSNPSDPFRLYVLDAAEGDGLGFSVQALVLEPVVSPDGSMLAYRSLTGLDSGHDIYVSNIDGTDERRITDLAGNGETRPVWSADGRRLIFAFRRASPGVDILEHDLDTEEQRVIAVLQTDATFVWAIDLEIAVSGSGEIAVADSGSGSIGGVFVAGPDGGVPTLVHSTASVERRVEAVAWSLDGSRLAFLESRRALAGGVPVGGVTDTRVYMAEPGGGPVTQLAHIGTGLEGGVVGSVLQPPFSVCWTGDGEHVVFTAPDGAFEGDSGFVTPTSHVYAVSAQGGEPVAITSSPGVADTSVSCAVDLGD